MTPDDQDGHTENLHRHNSLFVECGPRFHVRRRLANVDDDKFLRLRFVGYVPDYQLQ